MNICTFRLVLLVGIGVIVMVLHFSLVQRHIGSKTLGGNSPTTVQPSGPFLSERGRLGHNRFFLSLSALQHYLKRHSRFFIPFLHFTLVQDPQLLKGKTVKHAILVQVPGPPDLVLCIIPARLVCRVLNIINPSPTKGGIP